MRPFYPAAGVSLILLVGQLLHVLLEELLVLRGEIVAAALAGEHGLAEPRGEVAPAPAAVALGAELVDGLPVPVRVVGLLRRVGGLVGLLGLGLLLLLLGLALLRLALALCGLDAADHLAHLVGALA